MTDQTAPADAADPGGRAASADSGALEALAAEAWESQMTAHPVYATVTGDRRFDDRLRANGPGALAADEARLSGLLARTTAIEPDTLSRPSTA